jgi:thioredoxin:protein disulfide reductase
MRLLQLPSSLAAGLGALLILSGAAGRLRAAVSQQRVSARMILATDAVHPASAARAAVIAQVAPGYHINAHIPSQDYLIPTELKFDMGKQFDVSGISYPKGTVQKLEFAPQGLSVYEGRLVIPALLKVAPGVDPGNYTLKGRLSFQACNETSCFPPATVTFALPVHVVSETVRLKPANTDVFGKSR